MSDMSDTRRIEIDDSCDDAFLEHIADVCEIVALVMVYNRTHNYQNKEIAAIEEFVKKIKLGVDGAKGLH